MTNITFGRYSPYNTFTHKLDARNKILLVILLVVGIFFQYKVWSTTMLMSGLYLVLIIVLMIISRVSFLDLLNSLNTIYHKTIIFITHDMEVVAKMSKRVLVLDKGEIVFDGSKDELFRNEEIIRDHSLTLPSVVKMLIKIKEKLNIDIDVYKYDIESAYNELRRVLGGQNE